MIQELKSKVATIDRRAIQKQRAAPPSRISPICNSNKPLERDVKVNTDLLATLKAKHQNQLD